MGYSPQGRKASDTTEHKKQTDWYMENKGMWALTVVERKVCLFVCF